MQDVDSGGGCARVQTGGLWELHVLSTQFFCEIKTTQKHSLFKINCLILLTEQLQLISVEGMKEIGNHQRTSWQ